MAQIVNYSTVLLSFCHLVSLLIVPVVLIEHEGANTIVLARGYILRWCVYNGLYFFFSCSLYKYKAKFAFSVMFVGGIISRKTEDLKTCLRSSLACWIMQPMVLFLIMFQLSWGCMKRENLKIFVFVLWINKPKTLSLNWAFLYNILVNVMV